MKITNIGGFETLDAYISSKVARFGEDKSFARLFELMFSEKENTLAELSDGYKIQKISYGECKERTLALACALKRAISAPAGSLVGLYMDNCIEWIELCWAILICGYRPLMMNLHLPKETLDGLLGQYEVECVITDSEVFPVETLFVSDIEPKEGEELTNIVWGEEIVFMSSGSMGAVKLCAYDAKNFYYQIGNSLDIVRRCPQIAEHYEGELKLLALLPLYHVFGFIAVYLWFSFFSRTLVFLKDMKPQTIRNTIIKHKVTHFFAVPLVWETVYKTAMRTVAAQGEKKQRKLEKGLRIAGGSQLGQRMMRGAMKQVRSKLFGESIKFLISGGGAIGEDVLRFFNGIGYYLVNGYGMTEVGISSVEMSKLPQMRNLGAVGSPFGCVEYAISADGELKIRGESMARRIIQDGKLVERDEDGWLHTNDMARQDDNRYFLAGRKDDIIVTASGKNINPEMIEGLLCVDGAERACLLHMDGEPQLLLHAPGCFALERMRGILEAAQSRLKSLGLDGEVKRIRITPDKLLEDGEFKLVRKKLNERVRLGQMRLIDASNAREELERLGDALFNQLQGLFAEALRCDAAAIGQDAHFFSELGGSSLDYFLLSELLDEHFGLKLLGEGGLYTLRQVYDAIRRGEGA